MSTNSAPQSPIIPVIPTPKAQQMLSTLKQKYLPTISIQFTGNLSQAKTFQQQYIKMYFENIELNNKLKQILIQKNLLIQKYHQIKGHSQTQEKRKRHRRNANQIQRTYQCKFDNCMKSYGSQGSLIQHIRIKHPKQYESGQFENILTNKQKTNKQQIKHSHSDQEKQNQKDYQKQQQSINI